MAEYDALPSEVQAVIANNSRTKTDIQGLGDDLKNDVYYPFRNKYVAWAGQAANNSFTFDYQGLQAAAEVADADIDALFPDITDDNIDKPSKFKKSLEDAAEEAERIAGIYEDYENAAEALAEDAHAQAFYNNLEWEQIPHYSAKLRADDNLGYSQDVFNIEFVLDEKLNKEVAGEEYIAIKIVKKEVTLTSGVDIEELPDILYVHEDNFNTTNKDFEEPMVWDENAGSMNLFTTANYGNNSWGFWTNDNQTTAILNSNDWTAIVSANQSTPGYLIPWSLYKQEYDDTTHEPVEGTFEDEVLLVDNMVKAAIALKNESLNLDDAEDAKEAAEAARDKANNWIVAWYTQADEIAGSSSSMDITYDKEMQKLEAQAAIAELDEELAALMAVEDPYDGESACQKYLDAVEALGTPAVEDDETTTEVDETAPATGAYLAVDEALAAKDAQVDVLKQVVNGIEVSTARLNIIWNDGSDNNVVGIMETVVNRTATEGGDNAIYNLNGMRVKNTGKGIFIQNGKKVIK